MIDIKLFRDNQKKVETGLKKRGFDPEIVNEVLKADSKWRRLTTQADQLRAEQKKLGKDQIKKAQLLKEKIRTLTGQLADIEKKRQELLENIPNLPLSSVPDGRGEADNIVVREVGKKTTFKFKARDYLSLAEGLDIIDVKRAAKVSGSRFGYLKGGAALLELALLQFAFDQLKDFNPIIPPAMIKPEVFKGMGRLAASQKEERYYLPKDNLYLVGSAEHTIGPLHKDEILKEKELPKRYLGFSTCFRREAGSYGKDTKGILRVHQFDKIEMFSFCKPEESEKELKFLVSRQEKLMQLLKLPYRVVEMCAGDLGWTDAHQYDIETWLPGEGKYRETHSASNTTDFQARGVNVRFAAKSGPEFVHMLNATGLAIGRTIISIIENYQTDKGTVKIPTVLQKYCRLKEIRPRRI